MDEGFWNWDTIDQFSNEWQREAYEDVMATFVEKRKMLEAFDLSYFANVLDEEDGICIMFEAVAKDNRARCYVALETYPEDSSCAILRRDENDEIEIFYQETGLDAFASPGQAAEDLLNEFIEYMRENTGNTMPYLR